MRMPMASKQRALEIGAEFIEADLNSMREQARAREFPLTTSLEGDLMKVAEWASAAATLRALAAQEPS